MVTVVSPPESSTAGGGRGGRGRGRCGRCRPARCRPRAPRLPARRQDQRREAERARFGGLRPSAMRGVAIIRNSLPARRGSPGLGASRPRAFEMRGDGGGRGDAVMGRQGARFGKGRGIGDCGAGGDHRRVVAGYVGDGQGDDARRVRCRGEPPALDRREVAADAVHLADGGAGAEQGAVDLLLVGERQPGRWQGEQRRAAAGDEEQHEVAVGQAAARERQMRRAAASPAASGTGWDASTTSMRRVGTAWS